MRQLKPASDLHIVFCGTACRAFRAPSGPTNVSQMNTRTHLSIPLSSCERSLPFPQHTHTHTRHLPHTLSTCSALSSPPLNFDALPAPLIRKSQTTTAHQTAAVGQGTGYVLLCTRMHLDRLESRCVLRDLHFRGLKAWGWGAGPPQRKLEHRM